MSLVLVEDLAFIRETLAKHNADASNVRRIAVLLRRILLEGDLRKCGAPRIGRVLLSAPDNRKSIESSAKDWVFYMAGLPPMFGIQFDTMGPFATGNKSLLRSHGSSLFLPDIQNTIFTRMYSNNTDGFLSDPVARHGATLIRRLDVINYICYKGHGVHSSEESKVIYDLIENARFAFTILPNGGTIETTVGDLGARRPSRNRRNHLDFALLHLFSTAYYLCNSPEVQRLEKEIARETN
jgi:hypothetical protein